MNTKPEFIPSLKDLEEIFVSLPPTDKWPHNEIKIQVAVKMEQNVPLLNYLGQQSTQIGVIQSHTEKLPLFLTFHKYVETIDNSTVWIYTGPVRWKDYEKPRENQKKLIES